MLLMIFDSFVQSMNADLNIGRPNERYNCANLNFTVLIQRAVGECSNVKDKSDDLCE